MIEILIVCIIFAFFAGKIIGYKEGAKSTASLLTQKDDEIYNCYRKMSDGGIKIS